MTSPLDMHGPLPEGREGWRFALLKLITPAVERAALGPHWQPVAASSNDPGATWWELVTRPLWGLAALGSEPDTARLWELVREAIARGVDPRDEWYVGAPGDRNQRLVESAAIGFALSLAPQELWEPLDQAQRDNLGNWLHEAAAAEPVDNNWHYFPVLAGRFFDIDGSAHLSRLDEFYVGDGWYQDGFTQRFDYYNPFGFHFYDALLGRHDDRLAEFAAQFEYWFAADGSAVPFGRSLGYRLAQGAFWGALAFAGQGDLGWGRIRALAQRHLEWWWRQPILGGDALLSVGYGYPNAGVVEQYMGSGSPYWATKFFLPLALASDHPFWMAGGAAVEDGVSSQPAAKAVVERWDGDVVLYNGQGWADWARGGEAKYAKFAYSTRAGFSISAGSTSLEMGAFDSALALSDDGGKHWRAREEVEASRVDGQVVWSRWRPWPDVEIETILSPFGEWHLRVHRIRSGRALRSAEGGFCQPWLTPGPGLDSGTAGPGRASFASSAVLDLDGEREGRLVCPVAGSNVLHPRTVLPMLLGTHEPADVVLTTAVYLGRGAGDAVTWSGVVPDLGLR